MKRQKKYWNAVMIVTCILCIVTALAYWLVPSVRAGSIPPIGGLIWHALALFELLIVNILRPFAFGIAPAGMPWMGLVILLLMTLGVMLLISMVFCLPRYFLQQRPWASKPRADLKEVKK